MRVQHKISKEIFRVILNHFDGYEFAGSSTKYPKLEYDILPEQEAHLLSGLTEDEYIDIYGMIP